MQHDITVGIDCGKRYLGMASAITATKQCMDATLITTQKRPDLEGPYFRQGRLKAVDCGLPAILGERVVMRLKTWEAVAKSIGNIDLVIELVTKDDLRAKKIKSDDLMFLALTAGAVSAAVNAAFPSRVRTRYVAPGEWKHQINEAIMWQRIEDALMPGFERTHLTKDVLREKFKSDWHNVMEAVGIVQWALWRLQ